MYKIDVTMTSVELETLGTYNASDVETNFIAANKLREVLAENEDDTCEYEIHWKKDGTVEIKNSGMFGVDWEDFEVYGFIK